MIDKKQIDKINAWRTCPKCGLIDGKVAFEVLKNKGIPAINKTNYPPKEEARKPILFILICPNCDKHWGI